MSKSLVRHFTSHKKTTTVSTMEDDVDGTLVVGGVAINDRGDGPAQIVIEKNIKAQAQRRSDATKYELDKIKDRVDKTMAAFELNEQLLEDNKSAFFVPDLIELEKIISDAIQKRRYQQQVMIFVVGYEDVSEQRLKTLTQINDFFTHYINSIDEKALQPHLDVDLDDVSTKVKEAMDSASQATIRLTEIKDEMSSYVDKLQGGKLASKGKKKLEKALNQAKDDIMNLTEKLMGAHTEIEEKEDQMTRLYKQLDTKNLEVMKYKALSEKAKNNTGQFVDDVKNQLEEKEAVINDLNRMVADMDLTIKQMEHTRDSNVLKLRNASEENQDTIEKLEQKVKSLQVLLEDTKINLYKQHKAEVETVHQDHLQEIELLKVEYQEKIDQLEEKQVKQWASDSEDEAESFGRKSNLESRRSNRFKKDGKSSRQASFVKKSASSTSSRQVSAVTTKSSSQLQPPETPDTMSRSIPDPAKVVAKRRDETPKQGTRNKSNLEPVHEVPFEGKFPIEDEEKWEQVPKEQVSSAFKQYRKDALFVVKGLQTEIQKTKEENHQKLNKVKEKVKEKEEKWEGERHTLMKHVGTIEKLRQEAEKEADQAVLQLESFVKEQEQVANLAEVQEKKALKKLTPEQRAKYMGEFQPNIPSIQEINNDTGKDNESVKEAENQPEKHENKEEVVLPKLIKDSLSTSDESNQDVIDMEQQTTPITTMARSLQTSRQGSQQKTMNQGDDLLQADRGKMKPIVVVPVAIPEQESTSSAVESVSNMKDQAVQVSMKEPQEIKHKSRPMVTIATQTEAYPSYITPVITTEFLDSDSNSNTNRRKVRKYRHYSTTSSESPLSCDSRLRNAASGEEGDIEDEGESEEHNLHEPREAQMSNDEKLRESFTNNDKFRESPTNNNKVMESSPTSSHRLEDLVDTEMEEKLEEGGGEMSEDDYITPGFDRERPLSASSQRSLFEKYRAQLDQRKLEIVERRTRATSMHGSLLSSASEKSYAPDLPFPDEDGPPHSAYTSKQRSVLSQHRDHSSVMVYSRAPSVSTESGVSMHDDEEELELMLLPIIPTFSSIGCMADVEKQDIALSPIALSTSSNDSDGSKKSYVADHPIVQDYLKTYDVVTEFKDTLTKILSDKDLMSASDQLSEMKQLEFDKGKNVQYQVSEMTVNVATFMKEASAIFTSLLANDFEAPVSDLLSRANTSKTRLGVDTLDRELTGSTPGGFINGGIAEENHNQSTVDPGLLKQIQAKCDNLQQDLLNQRKEYEERLNDNAMVMMEMQDTIQELQREMTALNASPSKLQSSFSRASTASESTVDPAIIFSRLDADRNQKALKRGLGSQKVSSEQYNEAVKIMDQYTLLPAKRLVHLVKKYTHHAHMKAIEANVRHSSALDDEVFQILEKMETLQNLRAQRWGEEMDDMAAERLRLSHLLLEALSRIEQESGIFMIKPILSYEGRNQFLHYHGGKNSGVYRPSRAQLLHTLPGPVPLSAQDGATPHVPAPTPAVSQPLTRPTTQSEQRVIHVDVPKTPKSDSVPVMGSSMNLIGTPAGNTWTMDSSVVSNRSAESPTNFKNSLINTPRILELDVNRMLIGQNSVSALTRAFQSNDLLVNASNTSVRSYMTIQRPSAQPNLRPNRPNSVGNEKERTRTPNNTPFVGNGTGKPASAGTPQRRNSSGFSVHARAKSEGAISVQRLGSPLGNHPLPPIKVPGDKGDASKDASRVGSAGAVSVINEETASQGRASSIGIPELPNDTLLHPSPPHTPPGSSLHASPTPPRITSATSSVGAGILAKASLRSTSRSTVHSATPDKGPYL